VIRDTRRSPPLPVYCLDVRSFLSLLASLLLFVPCPVRGDALTPDAARARVEHHLRHVGQIADHFESVIADSCPSFPAPAAWETYVSGETEQLVLLMAHLEQAWLEAKRTGDDELRRVAKAPRAQSDHLRQLVEKLRGCAEANGASFSPGAVWRRVEREVPLRQADVALPR
jgi:hypothetical protein